MGSGGNRSEFGAIRGRTSPLSCETAERGARGLGEIQGNEAAGRVEVVLSRVVDNPDVPAAGSGRIGENPVEAPGLEILVVAGGDAEEIGGRRSPTTR